jgi:hypothetical protein
MRNTLLSLLLPIFPGLLIAQQEQTAEIAPSRSAWFIYTTLPDNLENPVKVLSGKDISDLTLSKRSAVGPVKIPADGILRIVKEAPHPQEAGKIIHLTLAQALIPKGVNKALVILAPLPKPNGDLLFRSTTQDLAGFKGGDWLYLNLTNADIGIQLGEQKSIIKPGIVSIRSARNLDKPTNMPISYNYRLPGKQEWKLLTASTVVLMPTRREICVFSVDPQFGRISYHGITFPVE